MIRRIASTGLPLEDAVEDQETPAPLDEPEDRDEDEDNGPAAGKGLLSTAALLGFAAVLVVFAMVMSALYLRERGAQADSDRLLAASNAQLNAVQEQLNAARGGPKLDPKGYEAIKQCVQQAADQQRMDEEIQQYIGSQGGLPTALPTAFVTSFPTTLPTAVITALPPGASVEKDLKVCEEALSYLN